MRKEFLQPGKIIASAEPAEISTVLGSCVAVALYDQTSHIAGLAHYLLDRPTSGDAPTPRYGAVAIPALLDLLKRMGADPRKIQAKVYGGAHVIGIKIREKDVGTRNIEFATELLSQMKIRVLESNVGGNLGRKIVLSTDTFSVLHKFVGKTAEASVRRCRVAILDPSRAQAEYFAKALSKKDLQVVGVGMDAPEGWDLIYRYKPELLILGVRDNSTDGLKLFRDLKKFGKLPPVLVYSFGSNGSSGQLAVDMGAIDYVHALSHLDSADIIAMQDLLADRVIALLEMEIKVA